MANVTGSRPAGETGRPPGSSATRIGRSRDLIEGPSFDIGRPTSRFFPTRAPAQAVVVADDQSPKHWPTRDAEDVIDYEHWREERGRRGRKPRNKAGGRHEKNRRREPS